MGIFIECSSIEERETWPLDFCKVAQTYADQAKPLRITNTDPFAQRQRYVYQLLTCLRRSHRIRSDSAIANMAGQLAKLDKIDTLLTSVATLTAIVDRLERRLDRHADGEHEND